MSSTKREDQTMTSSNWTVAVIGLGMRMQLAISERLHRMAPPRDHDADLESERGSVTTEQAVVTGLLVVLAIAVVAIIAKKVIGYAGSINLNSSQP
jgi:hypothetical protein